MDSTLNLSTKIVAFSDSSVSNNPRLKNVDWYRNMTGLSVSNPQSASYKIAPGASKAIFDGTVSTLLDGTSAFSLALSTVNSASYRLTWTGGTNPAWRTSRGLALSGITLTFAVNANSSVTVTVPAGPDFTTVQVGDSIFIPHTTTGDAANVISVLNAGDWVVLGKASSQSITLVRPAGQDFVATTQAVALTGSAQFRAFSSSGLQIADYIDISGGFGLSTRKTYEISKVTDDFVEFVSTIPLSAETGIIPTASGLQFFSGGKKFIYIEGNQEFVVRVNGDTGNSQRQSPLDASDTNSVAPYMRLGPTWALTLVNLSPYTLDIMVIDCE